MFKVKEWLKSKQNVQFIVLKRGLGDKIVTVKRISDGAVFDISCFHECDIKDTDRSYITFYKKFDDDLIHVHYTRIFYDGSMEVDSTYGKIEINDLAFEHPIDSQVL
jgi:hypothetical protein